MLHTTFELLRKAGACKNRYKLGARAAGGIRKYGKRTPIPLLRILHEMGLDDALWCLRCTVEDSSRFSRLLAADFAEHVLHIFERERLNDDSPRRAIQATRDYANGEIDGIFLMEAVAGARIAALIAA